MSESDAVIFSNSSAVSAMISDLGVEGFNELLNSKLTKKSTDIPTFSEMPSDKDLEKLVTSGVTEVIINGQRRPILPAGE